jgi:hypothetical protein
MRLPELSSLEVPNGLRGYTMPVCVPMSVISEICLFSASLVDLITSKNGGRKASERQFHSLLLSGLLDTKLLQSVEYPVCKQFMRKTIGMWIGRRHPQLR